MARKERLLQLLKDSPEDSFLQHALAMEWISEGKDEEAIEILETILKRDPSYTGSYYQLGRLLERKADFTGAAAWFRKGMDAANAAGDKKAYNELRSAYEELSED